MSQSHRWEPAVSRRCHWSYCAHCGLVDARNKASRRAAGQACPGAQRWKVQVLTKAQLRALPTFSQETAGWKW